MAVRLAGEFAEAVGGRCCQIMWAMLFTCSTAVSAKRSPIQPSRTRNSTRSGLLQRVSRRSSVTAGSSARELSGKEENREGGHLPEETTPLIGLRSHPATCFNNPVTA